MRSEEAANRSWSTLQALGLVVSVFLLVSCEEELNPPPVEILGHWSTDAPKYADRILEIRKDALIFDLGRYESTIRYPLLNVESRIETDGRTTFVLHHREPDGVMNELTITYRSQPGPQIRFVNREETWTRRQPRGAKDG